MEKASLEHHLNAGRSLEEIGAIEGKHASTVSYWLAKHGLLANGHSSHAPSGKVDPERLAELVGAGLSIRAIAEELGVSYTTVRHWLGRLGLSTARMARHGQFRQARELGLVEAIGDCVRHGATKHIRRPDGAYRCARCSSESVSRRRRKVKQILVAEAGGACAICGYQRCAAALQFHHLSPAEKEFELAKGGITRGIDSLRREAQGCVLLCANCHAEVEVGYASVEADSREGAQMMRG